MKKVIISGHSQGLGQALAEHYLGEGREVFGLSRSLWLIAPDNLQQASLDLSDSHALLDWLATGRLRDFLQDAEHCLLINNAGTVAPNSLAGNRQYADIIRAVDVNITAPLLLSDYLIAERPHGLPLDILHIGSGAGRKAYPGWSVYGAGKAALDHHARCIAEEQHRNLRIASVAPGVIDTRMQAEIRSADPGKFPAQPRFLALKNEGALSSPQHAAAAVARFADSEGFGQNPVGDVRDAETPN